MMTIQPPAPVQKAMTVKTTGRLLDGDDVDERLEAHAPCRRPETGLTVGSSTNSQSSTLEAPASAPGM